MQADGDAKADTVRLLASVLQWQPARWQGLAAGGAILVVTVGMTELEQDKPSSVREPASRAKVEQAYASLRLTDVTVCILPAGATLHRTMAESVSHNGVRHKS